MTVAVGTFRNAGIPVPISGGPWSVGMPKPDATLNGARSAMTDPKRFVFNGNLTLKEGDEYDNILVNGQITAPAGVSATVNDYYVRGYNKTKTTGECSDGLVKLLGDDPTATINLSYGTHMPQYPSQDWAGLLYNRVKLNTSHLLIAHTVDGFHPVARTPGLVHTDLASWCTSSSWFSPVQSSNKDNAAHCDTGAQIQGPGDFHFAWSRLEGSRSTNTDPLGYVGQAELTVVPAGAVFTGVDSKGVPLKYNPTYPAPYGNSAVTATANLGALGILDFQDCWFDFGAACINLAAIPAAGSRIVRAKFGHMQGLAGSVWNYARAGRATTDPDYNRTSVILGASGLAEFTGSYEDNGLPVTTR